MRHDSAVLAPRLALVAVALLCCAWFALGARAAHDQDEVMNLISAHPTLNQAQAIRGRRLLDAAGALNPDAALDILRGELETRAGRHAVAVEILRSVVHREPSNIDAWLQLEIATLHSDPTLSEIAGARVLALAPPVPAAP
jgi:hypothetical protein